MKGVIDSERFFRSVRETLGEEYAKARNKANVTDPICCALYHAWRRADSARRRKARAEKHGG